MKKAQNIFRDPVAKLGSLLSLLPLTGRLVPGRRRRLAILKNDGLGDIILFLPYAAALHRAFAAGGYEVSLIVRSPWAEFVRRAGCADRVIVQPPYRNAFQWLGFRLGFWARHCFDNIVEAVCEAHDVTDCCHPKERVNIYLDPRWKSPDSPGTRSFDVSGMTIRERYAVLLEACGIDRDVPSLDYSVFADPVPAAWIEGPFIAFCADSSDPRRCWEKEKFAALGNWLWKRCRKRLLFIGSDRERAQGIIAALDPEVEAADLCGETTLFQLFTLVGQAEFLVSGDTGTAHAGAACGTRSFVICGRGEYGTFVPYPPEIEGKRFFSVFSEKPCRRCYWRDPACAKLPVYECISSISVEQVKQVIETHLPPPPETSASGSAG